METHREFEFSDREFNRLRGLVSEHAGISLSDAKRALVYGRVARRLRDLGLNTFSEYCQLLEQGPTQELEQFTNVITTNLTSFFRENHHFEHLTTTLLPELMEKNAHNRRLRIWSAGCSSGEEPYSIAITLKENIPDIDSWDVKILATDLDSNVLATAKSGVYKEERVAGLSKERLRRWFLRGRGENQGMVKVSPELQALISFRRLNLMHEWPMHGPFDIIFCRNVVIYFDKPTQRGLFERFAQLMDEDAHLFIGHSESLNKITDRFDLMGKTIHRKAA